MERYSSITFPYLVLKLGVAPQMLLYNEIPTQSDAESGCQPGGVPKEDRP